MNSKSRRVGTFTLGVTLVFFGVLFLLHVFLKNLDYVLIFHMWPLILIFLGVEILIATLTKKEDTFKYDFGALIIIFSLAVFAMGMAGFDVLIQHAPEYIHWNF